MEPNKVYEFFNKTENYLHKEYGVRIRTEIIKDLVGEIRGKNILDIGCGNGSLSLQYLPDNNITFLDISENMLEIVKGRVGTFADQAHFANVPFEQFQQQRKFDLILGIGLLAHVPNVKNAVDKISDMLLPDGKAVVQFSDYNNLFTRINILFSSGYDYKINRLGYRGMKDILNDGNMKIEKEVQYSIMLPGMGKLPDELLYKFARFTYRNQVVRKLGSDIIWLLKK